MEQQRAKEVVEWRSVEEQRQKMEEEQSAIQLKQQQHLEQYRKERAGLDHLSWRQRKSALYRANRGTFSRPSERTQSPQLRLPLIIKGTCRRRCKACWERGAGQGCLCQRVDARLQATWTARWRPS